MTFQHLYNCTTFRLGSWQFLAELPYHDVSVENLWRILLVMHQICYHDDLLSDASPHQVKWLSIEECQNKLQGGENMLQTCYYLMIIAFEIR